MKARTTATLLGLFLLLIATPSCKDDDVALTELQMLIRAWLFDDITGIADATSEFELEQEFQGFVITFVVSPGSSYGDNGTYSFVAPNNTNDPSGSGTWMASGSSETLTALIIDSGTSDEQLWEVLLISAFQLQLGINDPTLGTFQLHFVAN